MVLPVVSWCASSLADAGGHGPASLSRKRLVALDTRLTMLPRPVGHRVQSPARALQPCSRPVHRGVRVLEELVVSIKLIANLDGKVVLPVNAVREEREALVLVWV